MTVLNERAIVPDAWAGELGPTTSANFDVVALDHNDQVVLALIRLGQFRALKQNWDSYGSAPPSHAAVTIAERLIKFSSDRLHPFLPAPHVVPTSGGGVQLAWKRGDRELEIELYPADGAAIEMEFLRVSHGEPYDEGAVDSLEAFQDHLFWVIEG